MIYLENFIPYCIARKFISMSQLILLLFTFFNIANARDISVSAHVNDRAGSSPVAILPSDMEADIGTLVTVSGTDSFDQESDTLSYRWSFDILPKGSHAKINDPSAANISFTPDVEGLYLVKLIVRDDISNSRPAYLNIRAKKVNLPPVLGEISFYNENEGAPAIVGMSLNSAEDSDGEIITYEYDFGDGQSTYLTHKEFVEYAYTVHAYKAIGTYTVRITAVDDRGGRTTATKSIEISENKLPRPIFSVNVTAQSGTQDGYNVELNASSAVDPDGSITAYNWYVTKEDDYAQSAAYEGTAAIVNHVVPSGQEGRYQIYLEICDNRSRCNGSWSVISVGPGSTPGSSPPTLVYSITPRVGPAPLTVTFDASHSFDVDGDDITVAWSFDDGGGAIIGAEGLKVSHTYKTPGNRVVRGFVEDSHGNIQDHYIWVFVEGGEDEDRIVLLNDDRPRAFFSYHEVSRTLRNIPPTQHYWDFGDGTRQNRGYLHHQYEEEGTYNVTHTTIDIHGSRKTVQKLVTARNDGGFPIASLAHSAESDVLPINSTVRLNHAVNSQSATGAPLNFAYSFGDGSPLWLNVLGESVPHTYEISGYVVATLFVDEEGRSDVVTLGLSIITGEAPSVNFTMSSRVGVAPLVVNFDGSFSRDDGNIVSYDWFFGEDHDKYIHQYAKSATASHTFSELGTYYIRLAVTDDTGNVIIHHEKINILASVPSNNQNPVADFSFTTHDLGVSFDADSSSDGDGEILYYEWNFGDGKIKNAGYSGAHHDFAASGTYTVSLKVTDNHGGVHRIEKMVTVLAPTGLLSLTADHFLAKRVIKLSSPSLPLRRPSYKSGCEEEEGKLYCHSTPLDKRNAWKRRQHLNRKIR